MKAVVRRPLALLLAFSVAVGVAASGVMPALASANYSPSILSDTPFSYWRLGEAVGATIAADVKGRNALTYTTSGVTLGQAGAILGDSNTAATFNGSTGDATAAVAGTTATTNWSVEAWVNPSNLNQAGTMVYNGISGANGYGFGISSATSLTTSGSELTGIVNGAIADSGYGFPSPNTWYHVVMTRDTSTIRWYVNGLPTSKTSPTAPGAIGARFSLGAGINSSSQIVRPYAGGIDEAAVYTVQLSAGRIAAHFQDGAAAISGIGQWATLSPATVPTGRYDAASAFDASATDATHGKLVVFGGENSSSAAVQETWTWDGTNWTKLTPATSPSARWGARMAYDTAAGLTYLFGGYTGSGQGYLNDTWKWDGTTWTKLSPTTSPTARLDVAMAYDTATSTVVLFGGNKSATYNAETWSWNGTNWTSLTPSPAPGLRANAGMAYDSAHSKIVLFGGYTGSTYLADTWLWNGTAWSSQTPGAAPSARTAAAMDYNPITSTTMLFGGLNGTSYFADTWSWDGTNWGLESSTSNPGARASAVLAWDATTGNLVLFDGRNSTVPQTDTWNRNTPPGVATGVSGVAGNTQVTVSWSAAPSGGSAITQYLVTASPGGATKTVTASPATVTGLTAGTPYTFTVIATNALGTGTTSTASASVTPYTTPGAPTGATATAGNAQTTVSWTAPASNGGLAISSYTITSAPGGLTKTVSAPTTSGSVTGLTNGTPYTFTVYATNAPLNNGPASSPSNSVTPSTIPAAPTNVVATAGDTTASLAWTASANNGATITSYTATASPGGATATVSGNPAAVSVSYAAGQLTDGTTYTFTVVAHNVNGDGPASGPSNSVTPSAVPGAPTSVVATASNQKATVTWTAPAPNGGTAISGYTITPCTGTPCTGGSAGNPVSVGAGTTNVTITQFNGTTPITNGTTYTFQVTATNTGGTGPAGVSNAVTPSITPQAPTNLGTTPGNHQVTVTWTAPDPGGSAITGYVITPNTGGTDGTPVNAAAGATSVIVTQFTTGNALVNGTAYTFKVYATNSSGNGFTATVAGTPSGPPSVPTNVAAAPGNAQATVSWGASTDNGGSPVTGYTITPLLNGNPGTPISVGGTATSATMTNYNTTTPLANGTSYAFQVYASNSAGNGAAAYSLAITVGVPTAPGSVGATAGANQATVTWTASSPNASAITGYTVVAYSGTQAQTRVNLSASATQATMFGLQGQTAYTFQVTASNSFGSSSAGVSGAVTPTGTGSTYESTIAGDSPSAYWRLDDPSGSIATDTTGHGYDGTYNGSVTLGQAGLIPSDPDPAVGLDGGSAYVSAATIPALQGDNTRSVEIWFSTTSTNGQVFFDSGTTGLTGQLFEIALTSQGGIGNNPPTNTPGLYVAFGNSDVYIPGLNLGDGRDHHVVVTLSARTVNVYVDGRTPQAYIYSGTWASSLTSQPFTLPVTPITPSNPVWIGHGRQSVWSGSSYLVGTIDEVAVYPTVLSSTQVLNHEQAAQVTLSAPVIGSVTGGSNQATVTWTDSSNPRAFTGFIVTAYQGGTPTVSMAVSSSATSATLTGLTGSAPYTIQVALANAFSTVSTSSGSFTPTGSITSYASTVQTTVPLPVVYYRLSETGTTIAADSSGNGQTGTYIGTPTLGAAGALANDPDTSVTFGSGYVSYSGSNMPIGNAPRTVEMWLKTTSTSNMSLIHWGDGNLGGTDFNVQVSGGITLWINLNNGRNPGFDLPYSIANGQWHYIAMTFDGSTFALYLDGNPAGTAPYQAISTDRTGVSIGAGFQGSLDEVAVYSGVLSGPQANAHFLASGNSQPAPPATVTATAGTYATTVNWTASPTNPYPLLGYIVTAYNGTQSVNSQATGPSATSTTISGLQSGVAYTFAVAPLNNFGLGRSTSSTATTPTGDTSKTPYASTVIGTGPSGTGPIVYWRLGDALGSPYAADSSGNGGWALYNSGATLGTSGALTNDPDTSIAGSLRYNSGANQPTGNASRSVELWLKTTSTANMSLVHWGDGNLGGTDFNVQLTSGNMIWINLNNQTNPAINSPYSLANGQWHYVVLTWNGTVFTLYVDGTRAGTYSNNAISTDFTSLAVGGGFSGNLDEVAVYNRALNVGEISAHFLASGNSQPTAPTTVAAVVGANSATVTWTASPTNVAPITGYLVTSYNGSTLQNAMIMPPTATSAVMSGLNVGVPGYAFDVAGINNFGIGAHSSKTAVVVPTGAATYASTVLASGPSLYFRLGDGAGGTYAAESSGSDNIAILSGTYALGGSGAIVGDSDGALAITQGQFQYFPAAGLPQGSTARTFEVWIRTTTANGVIVAWGDYSWFRTRFQLNLSNGNQLVLGTNFDDHTFTAPSSLADGFWHYIALTYDGNVTLTAFVDGSPLPAQTLNGTLSTTFTSSGMVVPVTGSVDELAVYNKALTATDVTNHFAASGEAAPSAPTGVTAAASTGSAVVSWTAPTPRGSPVTQYVVTPIVDGTSPQPSVTVPANSTSTNITGLRGGGSYTFQVNAVNQFGNGGTSTAAAVTVNSPAPAAGLGQDLFIRTTNGGLPRGIYNGGWVSESNVPAMSTWTVEGFIWGVQASPPTTSNMAWGLLGGTSTNPSANTPLAGINFNIGAIQGIGACCDVSYVWPGGSYKITTGSIPTAMTAATPAHWALDYDGTNVRGFINGVLQFTTASASASVPAAPAGFYDQSALVAAYFDEFRISNVARYTATFNPPSTSFGTDPNSLTNVLLLYDFSEYQISKLPAMTETYGGSFPYVYVTRQAAFADWSAHGNHASMLGGYNNCCPPMSQQAPMLYQPYILRPGLSPDEVAGGGNPWECSCHFPEGNYPIDTGTGEFWHTFDDINISGRGPGIDLNRTYSSTRASVTTRFGAGWADSYNESVTINGNIITVRAGNGSAVAFVNNNGTYTASSQVLASLTTGPSSTYVLTDKSMTSHTFNSSGQLVKLTDLNGYSVTLTYDQVVPTQLNTVTDQSGRSLTFTYVGPLVNKVQDSVGRSVSYSYTGSQLTRVTDMGGGIATFTYDSNNLLLTMKDATCTAAGNACNSGIGLQNIYNSSLQVTQQTDYMGRVTKYDYTSIPYATKVTDPKGNIALYEYVGTFLMSTTREDSTGSVVSNSTYGYDPSTVGLGVATDPTGNSSTSVRDGRANIYSGTDALGRTITGTYNMLNEPTVLTDPSQVQTINTYDANGNLTQSSRPLVGSVPLQTQTVIYTRGDPAHVGDVTQVTDANGKVWRFGYDSNGYRNSVIDPLGDQTTYSYDAVGRLMAQVSPKGNVAGCSCVANFTTSYTVDPWGKPLTTTDPLLGQLTYVYDPDHRLTTVTDANHHGTTYVYDLDGEQTEIDRPDGSKLYSSYDADGNVSSQTDGLGHSTTYAYDALNRKTTMTDVLNRQTHYAYDAAGNLKSLSDPNGQTSAYVYDVANELVTIANSDGKTPNVSLSYDNLGHRVTVSDGSGTSNYTYDSLNRLSQVTNGAGAQLKYGYDLRGQLVSIIYPGSTGAVARTYDDAGRLATIQDWLSHTTSFKYDSNSNLTEVDYPNSVVATLAYDNSNRLASISDAIGQTQVLTITYARDTMGQVTGDGGKGYGYDAANRLTTYTNPPNSGVTYAYDAADRLTSAAAQGGIITTNAYDAGNQMQSATSTNGPTQVGKLTYGYDANGNRISATDQNNNQTTYAYDQGNRLTSVGTAGYYTYNADGLRMTKTVAGITEPFVWDTVSGLPLIVQDAGTSYVNGPGGIPLEQVSGATVYYFHADALGSTRALTDSTGTVVQSYDYDPFGNLTSSTGTITNPFQYCGQYFDPESGFYYQRARYFDPRSAQFISSDPANARTQSYVYAADSPSNLSDPTGLSPWARAWLKPSASTLTWTVIVFEAPTTKSLLVSAQLFHDGAPYGTPYDFITNRYGGTKAERTVDCLQGHWEITATVEGGDPGYAQADCKAPREPCLPPGIEPASAGMSSVTAACDPGVLPFPIPDWFPIPWPVFPPITWPFPGLPFPAVGLWSCGYRT